MNRYKLVDRKPVLFPIKNDDDEIEWCRWFSQADRKVRQTRINDNLVVSTVFLGVDHGFEPGEKPILYETMIFSNGCWDECERCCTWEEAELQHDKVVDSFIEIEIESPRLVEEIITRISMITEPETILTLFMGSVLIAEIYLKPDHKIEVCEEINKLLLQLNGKMQVILSVMDDVDDTYVRLCGFGLGANEVNVDERLK